MNQDDDLSPEDRAFRDEVLAFLEEKFTPELRAQTARQGGIFAEHEVAMRWHRALYERGWIAPSWPKEYGGPGWTDRQRQIFSIECARGRPGPALHGPHPVRTGDHEIRHARAEGLLPAQDVVG